MEESRFGDDQNLRKGTRTLKIGVNATYLSKKPTGLGVFTQEISRCIAEFNRDTIIFSPFLFEGVPDYSISLVPSSISGSTRFFNNLLRVSYLNTLLPLKCKKSKRDLLYCPMMEYPFVSLVPLVVQVHDLHPIKFASQFGLASVHFRISLSLLDRSASRVTVSSEFVKREVLASTPMREGRIDVVPLAFNRNLFYPRDPGEKAAFLEKYALRGPYILAVGNLFPYKNIDSLVEAFLRIKAKIVHSLVIVGKKEFSATQLVNNERVLYTDYVPDEDLQKFHSYADLLVHPSLSEGFGLTPLEAMACGTPVICSDRASLPEVVGDAGLLFDPDDKTALGELILSVLSNEGLRRELSAKGLKRAQLFSWEKTASGILDSCRKALEGKR